jgi:hypothetical protein
VSLREFEKVFSHLDYKTKKKVQVAAKASPTANVWDQLVDKLGTNKDRVIIGRKYHRTARALTRLVVVVLAPPPPPPRCILFSLLSLSSYARWRACA